MNFGRRLLDGAINAVSSQPNIPSPSTSPGPSIPITNSNSGPNWPPPSTVNPVSSSPFTPTNPDSPPQVSASGNLLSKSRLAANGRNLGSTIDITSHPGRPPGGGIDPLSIPHSESLAQPRPVRAYGVNNGISGGARKELLSLTRTKTPTPSQTPPPPTVPKWQAASAMLSAKEELLLELLSSEAILDSRDCEILASDQIEELKREYQFLSTRLSSASKKLSLQIKIRDAAISLSKLHPSKPSSIANGMPNEKVSAENRKVDTARAELTRISDRLAEVQRKLWEHRSGVLSYTVTKLEKELRPSSQANGDVSGRCTPATGRNRSGEDSPTSSSFSGNSRIPSKFEGPHLFAGHEGAALPTVPKLPAAAAVVFEERLKSLEESLAVSRKAEEDLKADLKRIRLQKSELENSLGVQSQTAEEEIAKLQNEVERMRQLKEQLDEMMVENRELTTRKRELEAEVRERSRGLREVEERMETLQREQSRAEGMENILSQVKQSAKLELDRKDEELRALKEEITQEREKWLKERQALEDEKLEDLSQLQQELEGSQARDTMAGRIAEEELETASKALQTLVRMHRVLTMGEERDVTSLVAAVGAHMEALAEENGKKAKAQEDWDTLRRKLEDDLRSSLDRRDKLGQEVEMARNEREEARKELRFLEERLRESQNGSERSQPIDIAPVGRLRSRTQSSTAVSEGDDKSRDKVMATLRILWSLLPSPEARAAKVNNKGFISPGSPLLTPNGRHGDGTATSLSELDVRALKSLYDPRLGPGSPIFASFSSAADFSIDAFEQRVRALLADDRAIIERLIRFGQAHDLLKNNAERAQKLAEESAVSLKTYQKQVNSLEDRNATVVQKQRSLIEEIDGLQREVEKLQKEKRELDLQTADQAETCKNLQDANNTLSARALALAEEVSTAPEAMRIKMEAQLNEVRRQLKEAQEDIDAMRNTEQSQRIALLDELNSMQSDNTKLREQLRAAQRK